MKLKFSFFMLALFAISINIGCTNDDDVNKKSYDDVFTARVYTKNNLLLEAKNITVHGKTSFPLSKDTNVRIDSSNLKSNNPVVDDIITFRVLECIEQTGIRTADQLWDYALIVEPINPLLF